MTTYIALINFTAQGLQNIHDSPHRAAAFKAAAKKVGVKLRETYWTLGAYDGVIVFDARDDESATAAMLALDGLGNVHTQTLRTFNASQFAAILEKTPRL